MIVVRALLIPILGRLGDSSNSYEDDASNHWLPSNSLLCRIALAHPEVQEKGRFSLAGLDSDREVEEFFVSFKEAIAKGDKKRVASIVSYPITVTLDSGRRRKIRRAAEFTRLYDRVFGGEFKRVIAKTSEKDLWANWSGVAMPNGEVWFNGVVKNVSGPEPYTLKITAINGSIHSGGRR
jgi:uncharacterized protein Veg